MKDWWWCFQPLVSPFLPLSQCVSSIFNFIFLYKIFLQIHHRIYPMKIIVHGWTLIIKYHFNDKANVLWIFTWGTLPWWRKGRRSVMSRELCSLSLMNLLILEKVKNWYVRYTSEEYFSKKLNVLYKTCDRHRWLLCIHVGRV